VTVPVSDDRVGMWTAAATGKCKRLRNNAHVSSSVQLSDAQRRGLIARLSVGYYEGWRPSRAEIADLVALELGILTVDECLQRERQRKADSEPVEITEFVLSTHRRNQAASRHHPPAHHSQRR
jgi:hypothetical protein